MNDIELSPEGLCIIHARQITVTALYAQLEVLKVRALGMSHYNVALAAQGAASNFYTEHDFTAVASDMEEIVAQLSRLANEACQDRDDTSVAIKNAKGANES